MTQSTTELTAIIGAGLVNAGVLVAVATLLMGGVRALRADLRATRARRRRPPDRDTRRDALTALAGRAA